MSWIARGYKKSLAGWMLVLLRRVRVYILRRVTVRAEKEVFAPILIAQKKRD
jgi:hypothetical protein